MDIQALFRGQTERLAADAGAANVHVVTPLWRRQNQAEQGDRDALDRVRSKIESAAAVYGFDVIDGLAVSAHVDGLYIDGLHLNDAGAQLVASEIARRIRR